MRKPRPKKITSEEVRDEQQRAKDHDADENRLRQNVRKAASKALARCGGDHTRLAKSLGVSRGTVYKWLNGKGIGADSVRRLADAAGVNIRWLLGEKNAPEQERDARALTAAESLHRDTLAAHRLRGGRKEAEALLADPQALADYTHTLLATKLDETDSDEIGRLRFALSEALLKRFRENPSGPTDAQTRALLALVDEMQNLDPKAPAQTTYWPNVGILMDWAGDILTNFKVVPGNSPEHEHDPNRAADIRRANWTRN